MQDFVHLHNHSDYSLLDGAAGVEKLVSRAVELDMKHLALTDHGNLFGALNFYKACKDAGVHPIIGCEFYVAEGSRLTKSGSEGKNKYRHFIALAKNETGYHNLIMLSSLAYTEGFYYKPRIDSELLEHYSEGLIATSACINGEIPVHVVNDRYDDAVKRAKYYEDLFGKGNFYLELQDHGIPEQRIANRGLVEMSKKEGLPLIATNDVHYALHDDATAQDILLCIGTNKKQKDIDRLKFASDEFYMKAPDQMERLFGDFPAALSNTVEIAERCNLEIPLPGPQLPEYDIPEGFASPDEYLTHLTMQGLSRRYGQISEEIEKRATYELGIISSMGFTGYFLIVWDFIRYALDHGIPVGPGRGSGAGSIVAYALNITNIDPLSYGLLFERFLNPERVSMPDFDVDFCFERRGEVIDYVTKKYGTERVGQIITFGRLKARAVIRDVARVLDLPYDEADKIAKLVPGGPKSSLENALQEEPRLAEMAESGQVYRDLIETSRRLEGLNRHASTHAAGIVIGKRPLTHYVPLYRDPKTGAVSTQFTWEQLEECGLVKMDFLGLKTLTLIKNTEALVRERFPDFDVEAIPEDDARTFEMLGEGSSTCVFQFESSGMQNILKRAKPTKIEDLIALNALYRPGPMDNIDQFIDCKNGRKPIKYPLPQLKSVLEETYGVIVYQEQVMEIAQIVGGYSLGQADILRRAMGKKKAEAMAKEKRNFIEGAKAQGFSEKQASGIFDLLIPFAGYGFNKSHAAAYSVVAYKTAYLKANFPAEFMAANLTNEINSPDKMADYISECQQMGIEILPPDANLSQKYFTVVDEKIVYGLIGIKNVGSAAVDEIIAARKKHGAYADFVDFLEKVDLHAVNHKVIETLINTGVFDSLKTNRATLLHNLDRMMEFVSRKKTDQELGQASLFAGDEEEMIDTLELEERPEMSKLELLRIEKEHMGFYFSGHPLDSYRAKWERTVSIDLENPGAVTSERQITLLGVVKQLREIQTRRGGRMAFVQLEDYRGSIELVVFTELWEQNRDLIEPDAVIGAIGKLDKSRGEPKVVVDKVMEADELPDKGPSQLHIRIDAALRSEDDLHELRDFLIDRQGACALYLHTPGPAEGRDVVIKASPHLCVDPARDLLTKVRAFPYVHSAWHE